MRIARAVLLVALGLSGLGDAAAPNPVYKCARSAGDHPTAECVDAARKDAEKAAAVEEAASIAVAERRRKARGDANLLAKFPDEATLEKARQAELNPLLASINTNEARVAELAVEKTRLANEKLFYPAPLALPGKLKLDIDANDALMAGRQAAIVNQQSEIAA